jgi:glycine/D-amino acid oxidase-like deaminating enzyme
MNTDVIIIGGGLMGASTALQLSMRGLRCVVLDKDSPGRHASGANAGGLRQLNRDPAEIPLTVAAAEMWRDIESLVDSDCDVRFPGQIRLAENTTDMTKLQERANKVYSLGYDHEEIIGKEELYQLVPALKPGCIGGLICRQDGYGRPYHTLTAFRRKAESLGAQFLSSCEVHTLRHEDSSWEVRTSTGKISASTLVNCAGAWANNIAKQLDEPVPLEPRALMLMVTERLPHFVDPVLGAASRKLSFKQMQNGTVIIGGAQVAKLDFATERTEIDWPTMVECANTVLNFFPQLEDIRIVRAWAGIEAIMTDNIPVIGSSQTFSNAFHAFGFSAHGYQLSPIIGRIMTELIIDGHSNFPLQPFRINRFQQEPT